MEEIQLIVEKLNQPPFSKNLRLVDFDEKSPIELLQVLNDVFTKLDSQMAVDVRDETPEARLARFLAFMAMLKYQIDENQRASFEQGLAYGEKAVVYPILHWCLQRLPQLQKRAYLARYLMPVDIPAEYLQDDMLADLVTRLKELQEEFKAVHKQVDQMRSSNIKPADLKSEIGQLEDERNQLKEKIAKLQRSTQGERGFDDMLKITSTLRQEQEEEARLQDKMKDQRMALQQAEARLSDASKRLGNLRQSTGASGSAEAILEQLQREVKDLQTRVTETLPRELNEKQAAVAQLEKARSEPQKSKDDVEELKAVADGLENDIASQKERIEKTLAARGEDKLMMFRQHAMVAASNRAGRQEEYDRLQTERQQVTREVEEKESRMSGMPGPKFMSREDFKQYGAKLREKTHQYKKLKQDLADYRAESVVLYRTEQILKSRNRNLDDFLRQLEAKKGVTGYRETQQKLEKASEQAAEVDAIKGQTLEEISNLVRVITEQLRDRKAQLQPQIKALKDARKKLEDTESSYTSKRSTYEKVAVGLEVERQQLEQECDAFQQECLREESRFHYFHALTAILDANVEKIKQEEKWERGEGRLLPDFRSYKELYQNKIAQQEALSKQLRRQQKSLKESEAGNAEQRKLFKDLRNLLHIKLKTRQTAVKVSTGNQGPSGYNLGSDANVNVMMLERGGSSKYDN